MQIHQWVKECQLCASTCKSCSVFHLLQAPTSPFFVWILLWYIHGFSSLLSSMLSYWCLNAVRHVTWCLSKCIWLWHLGYTFLILWYVFVLFILIKIPLHHLKRKVSCGLLFSSILSLPTFLSKTACCSWSCNNIVQTLLTWWKSSQGTLARPVSSLNYNNMVTKYLLEMKIGFLCMLPY